MYYTIFALAGLHALTSDLSTLSSQHSTSAAWRRGLGDSLALDFVHFGALARCWSAVGLKKMPAGLAAAVLARIETFRARDGGYDTCWPG